MSKHTKEPWILDRNADKHQPLSIFPKSGMRIAVVDQYFDPKTKKPLQSTEANAERIVACVNALREIENPEAVDAVLMAALKVCNAQLPDQVPSYIVNAIDALREALVKLAIPTERS